MKLKYKILLCLILPLLTLPNLTVLVAQRYIPFMHGIHLNGGLIEKNGFTFMAGYSIFLKHSDRIIVSFDYLQKSYKYSDNEKFLPLQDFTITGEYYYKLISDRASNFFLSGGGGLLFGYETINMGIKNLSDGSVIQNKDAFILGGLLGLEAEYYINNRVVLLAGIKERLYGGSSVCNVGNRITVHTQFYIGLKLMLLPK